jgi:hypothetical protein
MDDLDERLTDLGRRWREAQKEPPIIDPMMFSSSPRTPILSLGQLVRAAAVIGALGVGVVAVGLAIGPWRTGSRTGTQAEIAAPGQLVSATGVVVAGSDGVARICDLLPDRLGGVDEGGRVQCSVVAAVVRGLALARLPGWAERDGIGFSDPVTVRGIWTGDSIEASSTPSVPTSPEIGRDSPCPTPDGGWPALPSDELLLETALTSLTTELAADPGRYSGYWVTSAGAGVGANRIAVVGTVDDPGAAKATLESIYPFPLCVTLVQYSAADLARAEDGIAHDLQSRPDGSWRAHVSQQLDRVSVRTAIIDDDILQVLQRHPEAVADPLVKRS